MLPLHSRRSPSEIEALPAGPRAALPRLPKPDRVTPEMVYLAAQLLSPEVGAVVRLASGHTPRPDGTCAGHEAWPRPVWPCFGVQVAAVVERMLAKGW